LVIRRATASDIDRLIRIRGAVRENRLQDPASVTRSDYVWFVVNGRVWVAVRHGQISGFSASDPRDGTIWALFVDPGSERAGFGTALLVRACADLMADGHIEAPLSTDPGTAAAWLYRKLGLQELGLTASGELQFRLDLGQ
jgi:ribosomal protein S18 acetylase RimI-like enzyme